MTLGQSSVERGRQVADYSIVVTKLTTSTA